MDLRNPSAAFEIHQPRAVRSGVRPERATLVTRCRNCGAALRAHGPLEWVYRDDDRTAESEDGLGARSTALARYVATAGSSGCASRWP
jgi:hypothetical protein